MIHRPAVYSLVLLFPCELWCHWGRRLVQKCGVDCRYTWRAAPAYNGEGGVGAKPPAGAAKYKVQSSLKLKFIRFFAHRKQ